VKVRTIEVARCRFCKALILTDLAAKHLRSQHAAPVCARWFRGMQAIDPKFELVGSRIVAGAPARGHG
jgi:hypothetical protein